MRRITLFLSLLLLLLGVTKADAQLAPSEVTPGKTIVLKSVSNLKNHYFMTGGDRSVVYNPDKCNFVVEAVPSGVTVPDDNTKIYFVLKNGNQYISKTGGTLVAPSTDNFTTTVAVFYAQSVGESGGITESNLMPGVVSSKLVRFRRADGSDLLNCGDVKWQYKSQTGGYSAFYVYESTDVDGIISAHIYEDTQFNTDWTEAGIAGTSPEAVTDVTAEGAKSYWIRNAADNTKYLSSTTTATETLAEFGRFMFVAVTGKSHVYKIYNVVTQKYLKWKAKTDGTDKTEWVDAADNDESLYWWIRRDEGATTAANAGWVDVFPYGEFKQSWNWHGGASATNPMGLYQYTDGKSKWTLVEYSDAKTITIKHTYNKVVFQTEQKNVRVGAAYDLTANMHIAGLAAGASFESYTITVDTPEEVSVDYTLSGMPFEVSTITDGQFVEGSTHWYTMRLREKYLFYEEATNGLKCESSTTPDATLSRYLFAFVGDPVNGYKVYNRATGATKVMGGPADNGAKVILQAEATEDTERFVLENYGHYVFRKKGTANTYLNDFANNGYCAYWTDGGSSATTDGGSKFLFAAVSTEALESLPLNDAKDVLAQAISRANQYAGDGDNLRIGTRLNLYQNKGKDITTRDAFVACITTAQTALADGNATVESLTGAATDLTTVVNGLELNKPEKSMFLRVRATNANQGAMPYLASGNTTVEGMTARAAFSGTKDEKTIFYFDQTRNSLVGYSTGYYLKDNGNFAGYATEAPDNTATTVSFQDAGNKAVGAYSIKFKGSRWLYTQKSTIDDVDYYYSDAGDGASGAGYNYWLEEVTELPVKIVEGRKFATFWSPVGVTVPGTVEVYTVDVDEAQNVVVLTKQEAGTKFPAGTGMLLHGDAGTHNFQIDEAVTGEPAGDLQGQSYLGTYTYDAATSMVYTLQQMPESSNMGFRKYNGSLLPAFKAYLDLDGVDVTASALGMIFAGDATGVEGVEVEDSGKAAVIYDLSGRRVASPKKGLYIVNGKKVIIK